MREIWDGTRPFDYPTPIIPGPFGVGRVIALGPDSTSLKIGQLVYVDTVVHSRDEPNHTSLTSFMRGTGGKLIDYWRDGTFAQYKAAPLESVFPLNEKRLIGGQGSLGYQLEDLAALGRMMVPYGGLKDIGLQTGETIVIGPATGGYGMCSVHLAVSMGAQVIALGRNMNALTKLEELYPGKVLGVQMSGSVETDLKNIKDACAKLNASTTHTQPDVFFDISPGFAPDPPHIQAGILALKPKGRVSFMGTPPGNVTIPYLQVMINQLTIKGKWMFERSEILDLIRLVELGIVQIGGKSLFGKSVTFGLEQWKEAFDHAATSEDNTVIVP